MDKSQFQFYKRTPYNSDLKQMFVTHVENMIASGKVRKTDLIYLEAFIKDKNHRGLQQSAQNIVEQMFERS